MALDLVTVGGLTVDNVIAADGTVALAQAGGNGAYSAVGAMLWQPRVGIVSTAVASYPRETLDRLEKNGVDLAGVRWVDTRLVSCNWFIYDAAGRRDEKLSSSPKALAEAGFPTDRLTPEQTARWRSCLLARNNPDEVDYSEFRTRHPMSAEQVPGAWLDARGVHLAPSAPEVMATMADRFAARGTVITADPGWQLAACGLDEIAPLLSRLDAFLPSEVELQALVPDTGLSDALAILSGLCTGAVAVKLGPKGVLVWDRARSETILVPPREAVTVDPTGAGDSFCGGFLAGLVETGDAVSAAQFGAISAARIVTCFGADESLPVDTGSARAALKREVLPCP